MVTAHGEEAVVILVHRMARVVVTMAMVIRAVAETVLV